MIIFIFQTGEPLPGNVLGLRKMRAWQLAESLVNRGHFVYLFSSAFCHATKIMRTVDRNPPGFDKRLTIVPIKSPGYKQNISILRIFDHLALGCNLLIWLLVKNKVKPDICFIGYPPLEFCLTASIWSYLSNIPYIIDVKDQWPDIFYDGEKGLRRQLMLIASYPYSLLFGVCLRNSKAYSAISKDFVDWLRSRYRLDRKDALVAYLARECFIERASFDQDTLVITDKLLYRVNNFTAGYDFCILFVGNLMVSAFNFKPVISCAQAIVSEGLSVGFIICGDGSLMPELMRETEFLDNVYLPGFVTTEQLYQIGKNCSAALAPIVNRSDFQMSLPNKIIDYLALGLPILTALRGASWNLLSSHNCGLLYNEEDSRSLLRLIKILMADRAVLKEMSSNSSRLFKAQFDAQVCYPRLVSFLEEIAHAA